MREQLHELKEKGFSIKVVCRLAAVDYMVIHRFIKGTGRDLTPQEEDRIAEVYEALKGV